MSDFHDSSQYNDSLKSAYDKYVDPNKDYSADFEKYGLNNDKGSDQIIKQQKKEEDNKESTTEETEQKGEQSKEPPPLPGQPGSEDQVNLETTLFGLPPIYNDDPITGSLVKNSFPILKMRPIKIIRPDTSQGVTQTEYLGDTYKFVCQNDGSISYSLNNDYAPSMIEDFFSNTFRIDALSQFYQIMNTSRLGNNFMQGASQMMDSTSVGQMLQAIGMLGKDAVDWSTKGIDEAITKVENEGARKMLNTIKSAGSTMIDAAFRGQKIDMPNIWTGSSGKNSQKITIKLHCMYPTIDEIYYKEMILPLRILFRLASPYSKTKSNQDNNDDNENDIITYENPPYIEAAIEGMFNTRIGAIANMAVDFDFKNISYYRNRPYLANITLDIVDLYDVIVWHDNVKNNEVYAPNGNQITKTIYNFDKDKAVQPDIHSDLAFQFIPNGNSQSAMSNWLNRLTDKILSPINQVLGAAGNVVSTAVGNVANAIDQTIGLGMDMIELGVDTVFGESSAINQAANSISNGLNSIASNINSAANNVVDRIFTEDQKKNVRDTQNATK